MLIMVLAAWMYSIAASFMRVRAIILEREDGRGLGARLAGAECEMIWGSAGEFFAMGGYAVYVWGAYGVAAAGDRRRAVASGAAAANSAAAPRS